MNAKLIYKLIIPSIQNTHWYSKHSGDRTTQICYASCAVIQYPTDYPTTLCTYRNAPIQRKSDSCSTPKTTLTMTHKWVAL